MDSRCICSEKQEWEKSHYVERYAPSSMHLYWAMLQTRDPNKHFGSSAVILSLADTLGLRLYGCHPGHNRGPYRYVSEEELALAVSEGLAAGLWYSKETRERTWIHRLLGSLTLFKKEDRRRRVCLIALDYTEEQVRRGLSGLFRYLHPSYSPEWSEKQRCAFQIFLYDVRRACEVHGAVRHPYHDLNAFSARVLHMWLGEGPQEELDADTLIERARRRIPDKYTPPEPTRDTTYVVTGLRRENDTWDLPYAVPSSDHVEACLRRCLETALHRDTKPWDKDHTEEAAAVLLSAAHAAGIGVRLLRTDMHTLIEAGRRLGLRWPWHLDGGVV